jgi:chorismate lyase
MTECFLAGEELHQLNRDLRILIATNGTLTRILGVVTGEEIVVQIVEQQLHARDAAQSEHLSGSRARGASSSGQSHSSPSTYSPRQSRRT